MKKKVPTPLSFLLNRTQFYSYYFWCCTVAGLFFKKKSELLYLHLKERKKFHYLLCCVGLLHDFLLQCLIRVYHFNDLPCCFFIDFLFIIIILTISFLFQNQLHFFGTSESINRWILCQDYIKESKYFLFILFFLTPRLVP